MDEININHQGANSDKAFHGKGNVRVMQLFYGQSASLFVRLIRNNLKPGRYTLADLGGHKGELLEDILKELPDYTFDSVIIDKVAGLNNENMGVRKIVGDIINSEIPDKSIDIVIMRYVLPWDAFDRQKQILREIGRISKGIAIVQNQGAPNDNPKPLQQASLRLWSGIVPVLKRNYGFFTEANKIEEWMDELGYRFEKIDEKYIEPLSEMFIEKFDLNDKDAETTKDILRHCDGITVTTYLIRFNI